MRIENPHRLSQELASRARRTTRVNPEVALLCEKALQAAEFIDLIADRAGQMKLQQFAELRRLTEQLCVTGDQATMEEITTLLSKIEAEYVGMSIAAHNERRIAQQGKEVGDE